MGTVLYVPETTTLSTVGVIFLAGPIQGAVEWQEEAIQIIHSLDDTPIIACPRTPKGRTTDMSFAEQTDWETHYLREAGSAGVIMFWLAKESTHFCDRAYAQTTRFELGEWMMRHQAYNARLVVGIEPGFTNGIYLSQRLSQDCPGIPLCSTLRETCEKTVELFRQ